MDKSTKIITVIKLIIKGLLTLGFITGYILTSGENFLFLAVFQGLWFIVSLIRFMAGRPKRLRWAVTGTVVYSLVSLFVIGMFLTFATSVSSHNTWQYPFQIGYAMSTGRPPEYFPEEIPDNAIDYELDFMPSMWQADGHLIVSFRIDEEYVSKVRERAESDALQTFVISEYPVYDIGTSDDNWPIHIPQKVKEEHPSGMMYFLETNHSGNHPRGTVIVIDGDFLMYIHM